MAKLLIVDDEKIALKNLEHILKNEGYEIVTTQSGQNALKLVEEQFFDVVLSDLRMEKVDGMQILKRAKERHPDCEVIIITGCATLESAVDAMKLGAFHYISKPFKLDEVRRVVHEAQEKVRLKNENSLLREQIENFQGRVKIITQSQVMLDLLGTARQVAPTDCNVLISGESGTGKELFAKFIHHHSVRANGPLMAINCGAFQEDLLANELFGHEKGAFTGAESVKKGLIEMASGGTLFLDEVTEMSPTMQVKLLRVIQERELIRVGGTHALPVDVRFVAAANRDFHDAIGNGSFRQDLYFRLNVIGLHIPPLSDRKDDIALLAYFFVKKYSVLMKKEITEIGSDVLALLANYDFPGNVRELENIIERGVALSPGKSIEVAQLPEDLRELDIRTFRKKQGRIPTLEEQEGEYIKWVLTEVGWNRTLAAQILGIDRVSLWRKLKKMGLAEGE
ncbi:MAG: sigma-54 dependent transcriptional regulator [Desulfobulbaceae bacterium]|nr:sigma-54 dependent transcriptional regulator [Desulfobulbaceae bacterium]